MTKKMQEKQHKGKQLTRFDYAANLANAKKEIAKLEKLRSNSRKKSSVIIAVYKQSLRHYTDLFQGKELDLTTLTVPRKIAETANIQSVTLAKLKEAHHVLYEIYENTTEQIKSREASIAKLENSITQCSRVIGEYDVVCNIKEVRVKIGDNWVSVFDAAYKLEIIHSDTKVSIIIEWVTYLKKGVKIINTQSYFRSGGTWFLEKIGVETLKRVSTDKPYQHFKSKQQWLTDILHNMWEAQSKYETRTHD